MITNLSKKTGQLFFVGFKGYTLSQETTNFLKKLQPGGIIFFEYNIKTKKQVKKLISDINKLLDIKPFIAIDQEGGSVERLRTICTSVPSLWALGKIGLKELLIAQEIIAKELLELGFNTNLAPVLDINSNPNNPVISTRSISNNPKIVSSYGKKIIELFLKFNIIPVVKHFPGHGDLGIDSHLDLPRLNKSKKELESFEFLPFKEAIKAKVPIIMIGHIQVPQIETDLTKPASLSKSLIQGILRNDLNFKGLVITDELNMKGVTKNYSLTNASIEAITAGTDMILFNWNEEQTLKVYDNLVKNNKKLQSRISESYKKIISIKKKYLSKKRIVYTSNSKHYKISEQLADKSTHWIKKDLFFLPLNKTEPVEIIYPVTPKLRSEDLVKICKRIGLKKFNLVSYSINPDYEEIKTTTAKLKKKNRKVLITYDIHSKKRQKTLISAILKTQPDLMVVSVGLEYDIELAPNVKYFIAAYAPNYISLFSSFKKLLKND